MKPYTAGLLRHRLASAINALDLNEVVVSFKKLIEIHIIQTVIEKGSIPEIIAYPLDEVLRRRTTRMGFEDVEDVDVANLKDVKLVRTSADQLAAQEAAAKGLTGYERTREWGK